VIARHRGLTLGVEIASDAVRAVVIEHGRIAWSGERVLGPDQPLADSLRELAIEALGRRASRARLAVAVGPSFAQLRRLHGLPPVRDARTLAAIVQQSAGRYFRQNGTPMITTRVGVPSDEGAWAGAIEVPVVEAVAELGRSLRMASTTVVPAAEVLGHAAPDSAFAWHDGDVALELRYEGVRLASCRCVPVQLARGEPGTGATLAPALDALGDQRFGFAVAYAAAVGASESTLSLHPPEAIAEPTTRRLAIAGVACALGLAFLLAAPTIAAARAERRAATQLVSLAASARAAERSERGLMENARLLSRLAEFQRGATSRTLLLGALTCALDDETTLVSLQLEPSGGTLTARTPSPAALLEKLARVPAIASPAIVGSVTPESATPASPTMNAASQQASGASAEPLQHVTIHFVWHDDRRARVLVPRCDG
jgi:hypothetical protein